MRLIAISILALATLTGCMTLHAQVPEDVVRHHVANEEGIVLPAVCAHQGKRFSEGALVCMEESRMVCDPNGRWVENEAC